MNLSRAIQALCFVGLSNLLLSQLTIAQAEVTSVSELSSSLIDLRRKISEQAEIVRSKRKLVDDIERQSKVQTSQTEMQLAKVSARVNTLTKELEGKKSRKSESHESDSQIAFALREEIDLLSATIEKLPPIKKVDRLKALNEIEQSLDKKSSNPLKAYSQLISLLEAEFDLARSVGTQKQLLDLDGVPTPVTLFHIGYSMVVFRGVDGQLGYLTMLSDGGVNIHIAEDESARQSIEKVIFQAQNGMNVTQALLPLTVAQKNLVLEMGGDKQ